MDGHFDHSSSSIRSTFCLQTSLYVLSPLSPSQVLRRLHAATAAGDRIGNAQLDSLQSGSVNLIKVTKAYSGGTAVRELSLSMRPGQVFGLLGHNGAGKSTTIKCITGQTAISGGEAFVRGLSVNDNLRQIQQFVGICPQHDGACQ